MKLLYCPHCQDIKKLQEKRYTFCNCLESFGAYINQLDAQYFGSAIPLGIDNQSFVKALRLRPDTGLGMRFEAFVIPHECPTVIEYGPNPLKGGGECTS